MISYTTSQLKDMPEVFGFSPTAPVVGTTTTAPTPVNQAIAPTPTGGWASLFSPTVGPTTMVNTLQTATQMANTPWFSGTLITGAVHPGFNCLDWVSSSATDFKATGVRNSQTLTWIAASTAVACSTVSVRLCACVN